MVESDCRLLFPALTDLVALDLVGGDGQTAMPGDPLPEPVRVAVRAGSLPVAGAALGVDAGSGTVSGEPVTGADGTAALTWTLDPGGRWRRRCVSPGLMITVALLMRLSW